MKNKKEEPELPYEMIMFNKQLVQWALKQFTRRIQWLVFAIDKREIEMGCVAESMHARIGTTRDTNGRFELAQTIQRFQLLFDHIMYS